MEVGGPRLVGVYVLVPQKQSGSGGGHQQASLSQGMGHDSGCSLASLALTQLSQLRDLNDRWEMPKKDWGRDLRELFYSLQM